MIRTNRAVLVLSIAFFTSQTARGQSEGVKCPAEPTDMFIKYGDLVTCAVDLIGDNDTFRFSGVSGETVVVQVTGQTGGTPRLEVFNPDGTLLGTDGYIYNTTARVNKKLDQTGTYTVVVREEGDNARLDYTLSLERIGPPSPGAPPVCASCLVSDRVDPIGDVDLHSFKGETGTTVTVQATGLNGGTPRLEVFNPDGTLLGTDGYIYNTTARVTKKLDQTGTYTIVVREEGDNATLDHSLSLLCVGSCPAPPGPRLEIELTKSSYIDGDTVTTTEFRLKNPGTSAQAVEIALWLKMPDNNPISILHLGSDGSISLPGGYNQDLGTVSLFKVSSSLARGTYEFSSRLSNPFTLEVLSEDRNYFTLK